MTTPHYNVLIATPGSSMEAEYVKSLVKTLKYLDDNGISYLYLNEYSSQVNMAREATAMGSMFLDAFNKLPVRGEVTYDKMFWIDSDISWEPEDFMRLYESDKEIISGVYLNFQGVPMFSLKEEQKFEDILNDGEVVELLAAGFGFICIKSGVFENMPRPWFEIRFHELEDGEGNKMILPFGEDYSWCSKAVSCGFQLFLDPQVLLLHYKKIPVGLRKEAKDDSNSTL